MEYNVAVSVQAQAHFRKHKYLMVYTVDKDRAYVEGIYHDLQDYEGILQ